MEAVEGFPFRGYCIFARAVRQPSGRSTADVTIHEGQDGKGQTRYAVSLIEEDFATDALAKQNALRRATEWIYDNPSNDVEEELCSLSTLLSVPEDAGGGVFFVGIARNDGGFSGRVTLTERDVAGEQRQLLATWINFSSNAVSDESVIRMAIHQALASRHFLDAVPGGAVAKFELKMDSPPYESELHFN